MKADMPLSERQRIEAGSQQALRAAFVRRHTEVLDEQHALKGTQIAIDVRGAAFRELAGRMRD